MNLFKFKKFICLVSISFFADKLFSQLPIPIPIPMGPSKSLTRNIQHTLIGADMMLFLLQLFLLFSVIIIIGWVVSKFIGYFRDRGIKKLLRLLNRLDMDLILREEDNSTAQELAIKEMLYFVSQIIEKKSFARRVGEHGQRRMASGLELIKNNLIDLSSQRELVKTWIKIITHL